MENEETTPGFDPVQALENENVVLTTYETQDGLTRLSVPFQGETVWLTQQQIAELFQTSKQNVGQHIQNAFEEQELQRDPTVKESFTVQKEGERYVKRLVEFYNLDVIISVGYRVKSKRGTQFRIWATQRIKQNVGRGHSIPASELLEMYYRAKNGKIQMVCLIALGLAGHEMPIPASRVRNPVDVDRFLDELLEMVKVKVFAQWFKVKHRWEGSPRVEWLEVYMAVEEGMSAYRKRFGTENGSREDIRAALHGLPEWLEGPHTHRFGDVTLKCWGFRAEATGNEKLWQVAKEIYKRTKGTEFNERSNENSDVRPAGGDASAAGTDGGGERGDQPGPVGAPD